MYSFVVLLALIACVASAPQSSLLPNDYETSDISSITNTPVTDSYQYTDVSVEIPDHDVTTVPVLTTNTSDSLVEPVVIVEQNVATESVTENIGSTEDIIATKYISMENTGKSLVSVDNTATSNPLVPVEHIITAESDAPTKHSTNASILFVEHITTEPTVLVKNATAESTVHAERVISSETAVSVEPALSIEHIFSTGSVVRTENVVANETIEFTELPLHNKDIITSKQNENIEHIITDEPVLPILKHANIAEQNAFTGRIIATEAVAPLNHIVTTNNDTHPGHGSAAHFVSTDINATKYNNVQAFLPITHLISNEYTGPTEHIVTAEHSISTKHFANQPVVSAKSVIATDPVLKTTLATLPTEISSSYAKVYQKIKKTITSPKITHIPIIAHLPVVTHTKIIAQVPIIKYSAQNTPVVYNDHA